MKIEVGKIAAYERTGVILPNLKISGAEVLVGLVGEEGHFELNSVQDHFDIHHSEFNIRHFLVLIKNIER